MKRTLLILLCAASFGHVTVRAFVYENAYEFQSSGDFDGDGRADLVIVDKSTGDYRIAYQLSAGSYTWEAARASGIANATGLAIGKLDTLAFDSLAFAGPDANRVNVLDANDTATAGLPASAFIPSLGPNTVAAIDIGGPGNTPLDDLYVASLDNGLNPYRETLLRTNGTDSADLLADNSLMFLRERANAVLLRTNVAPFLAVLDRNTAPGVDTFNVFDTSGGGMAPVVSIPVSRLPNPPEYVTGQFNSADPHTQFLLYSPGNSTFDTYQVEDSGLSFDFVLPPVTQALTNVIDRLFIVPGTNGLQILAFDTNGVSATVYDFDGVNPPTPVQAFAASPGEHFTGAGILGNGGFMAYSAPLGQNTSAHFQQWNWNGTGFTAGASGDLPRITAYTAAGNVMQFNGEPFVADNPILLRLNNAGDWAMSPSFSGTPGNISVTTETFASSSQGLINPTVRALGPAHPLATFALGNQYTNMVSVFSFIPPAGDQISDVTISPAPGVYSAAIQLEFAAANPSDLIYFRVGPGNWIPWSGSLVERLFTNCTVQYYGQPASGPGKSAIKTATYSFTQPPNALDSNGDGVPDYVAIALGLDPNGPNDSDGDGYSDLEEIIYGTDPLNPNSVPTQPHLDDQAVFDLNVTPRPWDGFSNVVSLCATGTVLRVYDLQGSLLGVGSVADMQPAAVLTNIPIVSEDRLVSVATELHYYIDTTNVDKKVGREMVGLIPLPQAQLPAVPYTYGSSGGDLAVEASNWIYFASNAFYNLPRVEVTNTLSVTQTVESLVFELQAARLLGERGTNWWTNLTLFPYRVSDAGRTNPSQETLLSLEDELSTNRGYKLQDMFAAITNEVENSGDPDITNLLRVSEDIYRIDSAYNNTNPATFASPVDEIRYFLWNGAMDTNYLPLALTAPEFLSASNGVNKILAAISPRPTTNVILVVRNDTLSGPCRILDLLSDGTTFALLNSNGIAYSFPASFDLLPGTVLQVAGYTDVTDPDCGYPAIQVTSATINSVPTASDIDGNGNLLIDTWERQFFGAVGVDPFGDADGDGYSNLQEMLDGTDPRDPYSIPTDPPVTFAPPVVTIEKSATQIQLHFQWPAAYISRFSFEVRHTSSLGQPFTDLPSAVPVNVSGDDFVITINLPATEEHYYYLVVSLP